MATGLLEDSRGNFVQAVRPSLAGAQRDAVAVASAEGAAVSGDAVWISVNTDTWVKWGTGSLTASAADGNILLPAGFAGVFPWVSGDHLAFIRDSADGDICVAPLTVPSGA